jgi:hypothetical protein
MIVPARGSRRVAHPARSVDVKPMAAPSSRHHIDLSAAALRTHEPLDDLGTLRRGDPVGRPWRVRVSPPTPPAVALTDLSPLGPGQDYVDFARATLQASQPTLRSEHRRFSAAASSHLRRGGLNLMLADFAPNDQADLGRGGSPERHRRAGLGFHRRENRGRRCRGMINAPGCFKFMDSASHYRHQADHARRLAEVTWQLDLEGMLRRLAQDFDETAEDIEAGATEMRHLELLP